MFTSGTTGKGVVIVTYVTTTPRMSAGTCCRKSYGLDHTECWSSQSFVGNCCGRNHNWDHLEQAPLVFLLYGRDHKLVFSTTPSSLHISFISCPNCLLFNSFSSFLQNTPRKRVRHENE